MLCPHDSDASTTDTTERRQRSGLRFTAAPATHRAAVDREIPERSLVARVLAGDASCFLDLVNRHHRSMVRLAEAWGHDAQGADRIVRCAWRTVLERLSGFDGAGSLAAWLLRVVSELASATAPRRPADPDDDDAGAVVDGTTFDPEGRWASSGRPRSPAGTAGDLPPDALRKALAALPACHRVVITLRDVEALGPDDVAAVLGVTVAAQHALLHRARTALVGQIWSGQGPTRETRCIEREGA